MFGADNLLITPSGIEWLAEVFEANLVKPVCANRSASVDYSLVNRYGVEEKTCRFSSNSRRSVFEVTTVTGNRLILTARHRVWVMNCYGYWVWRKVEELRVGDYVVVRRQFPISVGQRGEDFTDEELYLLGVFLADGNFNRHRMGVTNNDPVVIEQILAAGPTLFGVDPRRYAKEKSPGSYDFHFNSTSAVNGLYAKLGWASGLAKDKHLGPVIRRLPTDQLRLVLQGYVDCESSVEQDSIEICSASWRLLFEVKTALQAHFGIVSCLAKKDAPEYPENDYWKLSLYGDSGRAYVRDIGFKSEVRQQEASPWYRPVVSNHNLDVIPGCGTLLESLYDCSETNRQHNFEVRDYKGLDPRSCLTYGSLRSVLALPWSDCAPRERLQEIENAHFYYDAVKAIDEKEPVPTFDFSVPGSRSLVVANAIVHDSDTPPKDNGCADGYALYSGDHHTFAEEVPTHAS